MWRRRGDVIACGHVKREPAVDTTAAKRPPSLITKYLISIVFEHVTATEDLFPT